jgi:hypothetical protein
MQSNSPSPFASVMGLGALKSQHPVKRSNTYTSIGCGVFCLVATPILLAMTAYFLYDTYTRFGPARIDDRAFDIFWPLGAAVIALPLGAYLLYEGWKNMPVAANLYDNGFAFHDRQGLKQVKWEQVDAVWQAVTRHYRNGVYTGTTHVYTIRAQDGTRVVLDDKLDKVEDLGNAVQDGASRALYPRYVAALNGGQRITFGPLAIDRQGIYTANKSLMWNEIKAIKIERGNISVKKEGGWFNWASASVPQIPNFFVFYSLIKQMTKVE